MRILFRLSIILIVFLLQITSFADESLESKIFKSIKQKDWTGANYAAHKLGNPIFKKIVLSQQFLDTTYADNSFEKVTQFLYENPIWPQGPGLRAAAENYLTDATNPQLVLKWFSVHHPKTNRGHKYYAIAASRLISDPQKLAPIIKKAWHKGAFSQEEQKSFHARFKNYLSIGDHIKRIDNLLFSSSVTTAKNNLYLVGIDYKKSFEAQIALMQNGTSGLGRFSAISKKYYTPGLIYRYIELKKKTSPNAAEIINLIALAKSDPANGDMFWKLQSYIAREYIEQKRYNDAYKIASCHFSDSASNISDAEFLSGWIALRFLNNSKASMEHFRKFNRVVKTPMSKARGIYWLARAHEAAKDKDKAHKLYNIAATNYPYTYYGQIAASELGMLKLPLPIVHLKQYKGQGPNNSIEHDVAKAAYYVSKYGPLSLTEGYIKAAVEKIEDKENIFLLANYLKSSKNLYHKTFFGKNAISKNIFLKEFAYPTPYKNTSNLPLEEALIYSIIRQESVFDHKAVSSASAMGLMQLIKGTACDTAKQIGDKCDVNRLTTDPAYNMKLGSNYLKYLINKFDGSYIMAIASYNGGHVKKWIGIYGDPRNMNNPRDVIDWIESIPFQETRNYVQRVLENLQIYRSVINEQARLKIGNDLVLNKKIGI